MRDVDTDVVVIGSGASGGWACKILTESGLNVTLLEAGAAVTSEDCPLIWYDGKASYEPADTAALDSRQRVQRRHPAFCQANSHLWIDDVDHPYVTDADRPFVWIRAGREGGRSNLWGGQCWRLTDNEFAAPEADGFGLPWPLRYEELAPCYEEVERFLRVRGRGDGAAQMPDQAVTGEVDLTEAEQRLISEVQRRWRRIAIPSRSANVTRHAYRNSGAWPRFSSLGSTLPAAFATGRLHVVHNAIVTRLDLDERGNHVRSAEYLDAVTGREQRVRAREFMLCASTLESTRILLNSACPGHEHGLGNGSGTLGRFLMDHNATFGIGFVETRQEGNPTFMGGSGGVYLPRFESVAGATDFLRSYGVWVALGRAMTAGFNALITVIGEMLPYAENTVTLQHGSVDRYGVPVLKINCARGDNEHNMLRHQTRAVLALARAAGMHLAGAPQPVTLGAMVHEVGTARMGSDPANSFCNAHAQSWELPNLSVPDGSCWTTSAYQNPTLTMMALTVRSSREVCRRLGMSAQDHRAFREARGHA